MHDTSLEIQDLPLEMQYAILVMLPSSTRMFARMTCHTWRALIPPAKASIPQVVKCGRRALMDYMIMNPISLAKPELACNICKAICIYGHISSMKWFHDHPKLRHVIHNVYLARNRIRPQVCMMHACAYYAAYHGRAQMLQLIGNQYPQIYEPCIHNDQCEIQPQNLLRSAIYSNDPQTVMVLLGTPCARIDDKLGHEDVSALDKMIAHSKYHKRWAVYEMLVEYANGL